MGLVCPFKERNRQHNFKLRGKGLHVPDYTGVVYRFRLLEKLCILVFAKIGRGKQFLDQDYLRSTAVGFPYQRFSPLQVAIDIGFAGHLGSSHRHLHSAFLAIHDGKCLAFDKQ